VEQHRYKFMVCIVHAVRTPYYTCDIYTTYCHMIHLHQPHSLWEQKVVV